MLKSPLLKNIKSFKDEGTNFLSSIFYFILLHFIFFFHHQKFLLVFCEEKFVGFKSWVLEYYHLLKQQGEGRFLTVFCSAIYYLFV